MNEKHRIIFILFACLFGLILLTVTPIYLFGSQAKDELDTVANSMIRDMAAKRWSADVLHEYGSFQFKKNYPQKLVRHDLLQWGKLRMFEGILRYSKKSSTIEGTTGRVVAKGRFDKGIGYIDLRLRKEQERWLMDAVEISKDAPPQDHRHCRRGRHSHSRRC